MVWLSIWWAWVVAGFALAVVEVLIPGFIFVGFAVGAVLTGLLVALGILGGNVPITILVFAVFSLVAWAITRRFAGPRTGQVKLWDKDINDN